MNNPIEHEVNKLKSGDYVKISTDGGFDSVVVMVGITSGERFVPDGWIITDSGIYPPERCSPYRGAKSCLTQ